jgi:predicted nucleotidyltransferase
MTNAPLGWSCLSDAQVAEATTFLAARSAERRHVVVYLSGAHAYGFPSPDSDLDLKAIHLAPLEDLCSLHPKLGGAERTEFPNGVELDYSSNELGSVLHGCLKGNGNYLERILGATALVEDPCLAELRGLVRENLSARAYHHYRGFAFRLMEEAKVKRTAKKVLYVFRATLTGAHLLKTGELITDVTALMHPAFSDLEELLAIKRRSEGEPVELAKPGEPGGIDWFARIDAAFATLDEALATTVLPAAPEHVEHLDAWFRDTRLGYLRRGDGSAGNQPR